MAVPEELVAQVVTDVSQRLSDPQYTQIAVGRFVQTQPQVSQFLSARAAKIGGEAVITAVFHAEVVSECLRRHFQRSELPPIGFGELNAAAADSMKRLEEGEPAIANYLASNVEEAELRGVVALVAVALIDSLE
ncbi:MAG: hypothetical protein AAGE52_04160 [Myxococcota bacterium]